MAVFFLTAVTVLPLFCAVLLRGDRRKEPRGGKGTSPRRGSGGSDVTG